MGAGRWGRDFLSGSGAVSEEGQRTVTEEEQQQQDGDDSDGGTRGKMKM